MVLLSACGSEQSPEADIARAPNILVIIGDDMGVETLSFYGINNDSAHTPNLQSLADRGIRFEQFWTQPGCSPTRAEILTGRHSFRTGVRRQVTGAVSGPKPTPPDAPPGSPREGRKRPTLVDMSPDGKPINRVTETWGLSIQEYTLPKGLKSRPDHAYATAAFGKWHLADKRNGWLSHPNTAGFDHFQGLMSGYPEGYFAWLENTNGKYAAAYGYGIGDKVDDALDWISAQTDQPWFVWLAFNSAHRPLHRPPVELINSPELKALDPNANPVDNPKPYFKSMIEAMDTVIGRLLAGIPPDELGNTYVIFLGDNGSEPDVISAPFRKSGAKNTLYEGGIHTPLIISGPGVAEGAVSKALVKSVDLFATVLELGGFDVADTVPEGVVIDSVSLVPYLSDPGLSSLRDYNYADFLPFTAPDDMADFAIRDSRFKYLNRGSIEELYDLIADPFETKNLLARPELGDGPGLALASLRAKAAAMRNRN